LYFPQVMGFRLPCYLVSSRDQGLADLWVLEQRHTDHIARTPDPVLLE
jgi:hypothetical protein